MRITALKRSIVAACVGLIVMTLALLAPGQPVGMAQTVAAVPTTAEPATATPTNTATPVSPTPSATPSNTPTPSATPSNTPTPGSPTPVLPTATRRPPNKSADPAVTKIASRQDACAGDEIEFTITVLNNGDATARDVVLTDQIPAYLDLGEVAPSRGDLAVDGRTITVRIGDLAPAEQVTVRVRARVRDGAPQDLSNTATITTSSASDDPSNNSSTATVRGCAPGSPTPSATPSGPIAPTPTPAPPRVLPPTGGDDSQAGLLVLLVLALVLLGLGLVFGRKARS